MVSILCSWSSEDLGSLSSQQKSNSDTFSTFEEDYDSSTKPVVLSKKHIDLPEALSVSNECEDFFTKLLRDAETDLKQDDSEEIFNSHVNRNIKDDLNRRNIIDKAFEKYDDPYAKFPVSRTPKTPTILQTPNPLLLSSPITPVNSSWKYITVEQREAWRKAAIEGQRDFCRVLIKKGIDPEDYISSIFSTGKKSGKSLKFNFDCSTPKNDSFSEITSTPFQDRSNLNTPISGIKRLPRFPGEINSTPLKLSLNGTSHLSDISINETFSPVHNLLPEVKSTLLSGLVCYVDVRSETGDVSKSVEAEICTLGARVEKNFTKKVTHVIFKEGKVSTYLKAKKEGIPLVSVLWIEACKRVRGIADPAQHLPKKMDRYENILPFQTVKKRRLKFYNPNSKIRKNILENYNDPTFVPTLNGKKLANRKAATVCKDKVKVIDSIEDKENVGIKKYCTKKLLFDKDEVIFTDKNEVLCDRNLPQEEIPEPGEPLPSGDSSFDSMPNNISAVVRRKSAPAEIFLKKTVTDKIINVSKNNEIINLISDASSNTIENNINASNVEEKKEVCKKNSKKQPVKPEYDNQDACNLPVKKKRKLYDPNEVYVSLDEGEVTQRSTVATPETNKRPRTKASAGRQLVKMAVARKRRVNKVKSDSDEDDVGSSPSIFVSDKSAVGSLENKKQKSYRTIVFTSVHRSDLPKFTNMVKKLGKFIVENQVTKKTTHVVCNGPRRTLNLIKGIARGCWILDLKWLEESDKNEKWLPEESYIMSDDYPCIYECSRERRGLKTSHVVNIFKDLGTIYVSKAANPPKKDLDELLKICRATFSKSCNTADIKIGGLKPNPNPSGVWLSEKWIIDSISRNSVQPYASYIMNIDCPDNTKESQCSQD